MEPEDDLGVVGVLRSHLEEINAVLRNVRTRESALDLADAIRNGKRTPQYNWIVRETDRALQHVEGYLEVEDVQEG